MKRFLFSLLVLLAVAAVLIVAVGPHGSVSLFWPPYRIDMSLRALVLELLALFVLLHLALRLLGALLALPRRWRQAASQRQSTPSVS